MQLKIKYLYSKEVEFKENESINLLSATIAHGSHLLIRKGELKSGDEEKEGEKEGYERDKREFLEFLVKNGSEYFKSKKNEIEQYLNDLKGYLELYLKGLGVVREVEMRLSNRGVFGVGSMFGQIPFEVGLYMHPYFNVPYIPASSIKGAIRSAYNNLKVANAEKKWKESKEDEDKEIFGDENFAGLIGFTDALPIELGENGYVLYPDIINPHYKEAKDEMSVSPNPIIYLTVAPGTVFKFFVYIIKERENRGKKREIKLGKDIAEKPKPEIESLGYIDLAILYGLTLGIGAKTSLGYSSFEVIKYE
jgi:CRISPR-associated protein Cmr6